MKKIGIMSMQRIINYGSFMQAYCLKKTIEKLGCKVIFVDYTIEASVTKKDNFLPKIKRILKEGIISHFRTRKIWLKFNTLYNEKCLPLLDISSQEIHYPEIDCLVIGSDEVFNCTQENDKTVGFSKELFGKNYEYTQIISYAACFGSTTLEKLKHYNIDYQIADLLKNFKSISVRDENSKIIVDNLVEKKSYINVDPVFLFNPIEDYEYVVPHDNFIILYAYPSRITKYEAKKIKIFAKKFNKQIISIGTYQPIADINLVLSPFQLLKYFEKADFIITDTFHGTIFSIKYNKKFVTIIRDSNNNKLSDLLKRMNLENRKLSNIDDLNILFNSEINYEKTNKIIQMEKEKSINYLKKNLGV